WFKMPGLFRRQLVDEDRVAGTGRQRDFREGRGNAASRGAVAGRDHYILFAIQLVGHRVTADRGVQTLLPENLTGLLVPCLHVASGVTTEHKTTTGRQQRRRHGRALTHLPERLALRAVDGHRVDQASFGDALGQNVRAEAHCTGCVTSGELGLRCLDRVAGLGQRNVEGLRQRAVCACLPELATRHGGADQHFLAKRLQHQIFVDVNGTVLIDLADGVLVHGFLVPEILAGVAVESKGDAVLARHRHQQVLGLAIFLDVNQNALERAIQIPVIAGEVLVVPLELTRIEIERERRVRVERRAIARATDQLGVRRWHADAPERGVGARVIGTGCPRRAAPAVFRRNVAPACLLLRVVRIVDRVKAPELFTRVEVVRDDVAAASRSGNGAAGDCRDNLVVHNDRADRVAVALVVVERLDLTDDLAVLGIKNDDAGVDGRQDNCVLVERDRVLLTARLIDLIAPFGRDLCKRRAVFPDQVAGLCIKRLDDVVVRLQEQDAVMHQRRGFLDADIGHRPCPGKLQVLDRLAVDLVERAVALIVNRAAPGQPFGLRRVQHHFVGYRLIVFTHDLGLSSAGEYGKSDRQCQHRLKRKRLHQILRWRNRALATSVAAHTALADGIPPAGYYWSSPTRGSSWPQV